MNKYLEYFEGVYYINLDSRTDRKKKFEKMAEEFNIPAIRVSAQVASEDEATPLYIGHVDSRRKFKMGCTMSHQSIVRTAKENGFKNCLIFEDDCVLLDSYKEKIQLCVDELKNIEWDLFYLGGEPNNYCKSISDNLVEIKNGGVYATHAYAINHIFYDKMLSIKPNQIDAIDILYLNCFDSNYRKYVLSKDLLAVQSESYSDLLDITINRTQHLIDGWNKYVLSGKVSFVCTTFGRFTCVERIVAQYHAQNYQNKELIIFNTDIEHPYILGFDDDSIIIVNNALDYQTGKPYENRGQICRDAVTHATGDYFMLADDDDIYLPWHMEQAVDGIKENGKDAWKPEMSFFATQTELKLVKNTLEASVIVKMNRIKEIRFRSDITGYEGLSWYTKLRDEKELDENNKNYIPSYCFNWSDPAEVAGHKQSGNIGSIDNFENHKKASTDYAKRPLEKMSQEKLKQVYLKYYDWLKDNKDSINHEYYKKYAEKYIKT